MPVTELCVIHPRALSAACWARLASHLPPGAPVKVLELETINRFWADDEALTIEALADRLRGRLGASRAPRVLVGWGVGGVVADALGLGARRVVVLDTVAPGAPEPDEAQRLRSFVMYLGARKGRTLDAGSLEQVAEVTETAPAAVQRAFEEHSTRVLRDHRLTAGYVPSGTPLTVVKAARSLQPDSPALGWDRFGPVERLGSGGDHYSMLTDNSAAAHLAILLQRWLAPGFSSAA